MNWILQEALLYVYFVPLFALVTVFVLQKHRERGLELVFLDFVFRGVVQYFPGDFQAHVLVVGL